MSPEMWHCWLKIGKSLQANKKLIFICKSKMHVMNSNQFSVVDDGNTVSEEVSLVHKVGWHDDGPARLVLDQQIPNAAARVWVHTCGRLIQDYNTKEKSIL